MTSKIKSLKTVVLALMVAASLLGGGAYIGSGHGSTINGGGVYIGS